MTSARPVPDHSRADGLRILFLSEKDPESRRSWSGISKSVIDELRRRGHGVLTGDVEVRGLTRWLAAAATFSWNRKRWGVRYRLGRIPFALRSRRAAKLAAARVARIDCLLQVGATFTPRLHGIPTYLYCDSNIQQAVAGARTGQSPAVWLSDSELDGVIDRERGVYERAECIFTICDRLRSSFLDDFGLPPERVKTVFAGPNFEEDQIRSVAGASLTKRKETPATILFVGAQFERKGGDVLLAAFEEVRARIPDARLLIVGPDLAEVAPGVQVLGYLDKDDPEGRRQLFEAYTSADVFCLPTRYEPFGVAFVEAMFFGLPCIGTAVWAVPEIIVDGKTGYLVPPNDAGILAERLTSLLAEPERAREMGAAGRRRAQRYFTWEAVIDRMLAVIDERRG